MLNVHLCNTELYTATKGPDPEVPCLDAQGPEWELCISFMLQWRGYIAETRTSSRANVIP